MYHVPASHPTAIQ